MKKFLGLIAAALLLVPSCSEEQTYPEVKGVIVAPTAVTLPVGGQATLSATINPSNLEAPVVWASNKPEIAVVENGVVTALSVGTATISAKTIGNLVGICTVKVIIPAASVELNKYEITLTEGETATLTATVYPEDATDKSVTWSSSDNAIATVADGVVTAVKEGTAKITAKSGDASVECNVTVEKLIIPVESIEIDPESAEIYVGSTRQLTAKVLPENATDKTVTWEAANEDDTVLSVDENGLVTALSAGVSGVYAKSGEVSAYCTITVLEIPAETPGLLYGTGFEESDGGYTGWTLIDADNDGRGWNLGSYFMSSPQGHNGSSDLLLSQSYSETDGALNPDNWAFTPAVTLSANFENYVSAWLCAQDKTYASEHFAIYVTEEIPTTGDIADGCELLGEYTMTPAPKPGAIAPRVMGEWYFYDLEIPGKYSGKTVYIGYRHFNCSDMFYLDLDDIEVYSFDPSDKAPKKSAFGSLSVSATVKLSNMDSYRH